MKSVHINSHYSCDIMQIEVFRESPIGDFRIIGKEALRLAEAMLTPKQERFIDEYLVDFNARQAAIRAGYSAKTAQPISSELLSKPIIRAEIDRRRKETAEKLNITKEQILQEYASIALASGIELKGSDKMKALEFWGKYFGLIDGEISGRSELSLANTIRKAFEMRVAEEKA